MVRFEVASRRTGDERRTHGFSGGPGSADPERVSYSQAPLTDLIAGTAIDHFPQMMARYPGVLIGRVESRMA
jgi:hypothetical protein